jgi:RNA polymerase sigma-70 factor (ECF subfamily)
VLLATSTGEQVVSEFAEFYAATHRKLFRAVVLVTGSVEEAQDCLQEAYIRAADRWQSVSGHDSPEAWVRRVALHLAYDGHRRLRVRRRGALAAPRPEPVPGPDATSTDIVRAVRSLPRDEQEVIIRHHLLDMTVGETARELGRPEGTVKAQLVRGRARLSQLLSMQEENSPHD